MSEGNLEGTRMTMKDGVIRREFWSLGDCM